MLKSDELSHRFSKPIINLSVWSIALGVCVMILSVSIVTGFQREIRNKVIGFGSHIQINSFNANTSMESDPVSINQDFYSSLAQEPGVKNIHVFAMKPSMLQSQKKDENDEWRREIQGVITKGIDAGYNWDFFKNNLEEGRLPLFTKDSVSKDILLSKTISTYLNIKIGDTISAYFINNNAPRERKFIVCGIYHTGLEEFDRQFVFIDINHIRTLNNWGVEAICFIRYETFENQLIVEAGSKGSGSYLYDFGKGVQEKSYLLLKPKNDTTIRVVVYKKREFSITNIDPESSSMTSEEAQGEWIPDTAWIAISYYPKISDTSEFNLNETPEVDNSGDTHYVYHFPGLNVITKMRSSGGSRKYYAGGFEVLLKNWHELEKADEYIYKHIGPEFKSQTIKDIYPEIFKWLSLLNINVWVILVLMVIVSLINMCSTLLVLILERTNMIGVLKSIGGTNKMLQKTFLWNGFFLITKGLIIGNILGIGLAFLQLYSGVITIDQNTYFINVVPVNLDVLTILLINICTLLLCFTTLLLPAYLVSRISPVKAIRFD